MSRVTLKSQATAHAAVVEALSLELARLRLLNAVLENRLAEHEAVVAAPAAPAPVATTSRVKTIVRAAYVMPEWQVERAAQMAQAKARAMESGRTVRA